MTKNLTRLAVVGFALLTLILLLAIQAGAYPEPGLVPRSWELDFTFKDPRRIAVKGVDGRTQWYWYVIYKVVNNTSEERLFVPEFTLATDHGNILVAGEKVKAGLFDVVKAKERNALLESPKTVVGKLLRGEDYAKESVAIWPAFEQDVDRFNLFVAGISGETTVIKHPRTGDEVVLRKTLMLDYTTPGTGVRPQDQPIVRKGKRWVMR